MDIPLRRLDEPLVRGWRHLYSALQRTFGRLHRIDRPLPAASHDGFNRFLKEYALRNPTVVEHAAELPPGAK